MAELEEAEDTRSFTQARSDFDRAFERHIQRVKQEPHRSTTQLRDGAGRFTTAQREAGTRSKPKATHRRGRFNSST